MDRRNPHPRKHIYAWFSYVDVDSQWICTDEEKTNGQDRV